VTPHRRKPEPVQRHFTCTLPDGTVATRNSYHRYIHAVAVRMGEAWSVWRWSSFVSGATSYAALISRRAQAGIIQGVDEVRILDVIEGEGVQSGVQDLHSSHSAAS
jgi:hypothetical protein